MAELEAYMRDVVGKEIDRSAIEFGSELGSGEFGSVFEGERCRHFQLYCPISLLPLVLTAGFYVPSSKTPRIKVAIKMLRKCPLLP